MYKVRPPPAHGRNERRVAQAPEVMRARIARRVGHRLERIAFCKGDVPREYLFEAVIPGRALSRVPSEEHLDFQITALRQTPVERHVVLHGMGNDEGEAELRRHNKKQKLGKQKAEIQSTT